MSAWTASKDEDFVPNYEEDYDVEYIMNLSDLSNDSKANLLSNRSNGSNKSNDNNKNNKFYQRY